MSTVPEIPLTHEERAQAMMVQLRQLAQSITGFTFVPTGRRRKLTASASVPDVFLEAVAVACDASSQLAIASQLTGAQLRSGVTFSRVFESVASEMELTARGIRDTIATSRSELGNLALRAYSTAKRINAPEDRELLIPHIREMKRTLGRGKKRAATAPLKAAASAPAPTEVRTSPSTAPAETKEKA